MLEQSPSSTNTPQTGSAPNSPRQVIDTNLQSTMQQIAEQAAFAMLRSCTEKMGEVETNLEDKIEAVENASQAATSALVCLVNLIIVVSGIAGGSTRSFDAPYDVRKV